MSHFRSQILVAAVVLVMPVAGFAVPLLEEAFNYSTGNLITQSSNAWTSHSGTLNPIQVVTGSLTKATVPTLGGNSAKFVGGSGSREDDNRTVAGITGTDGTSVYYSCLLRVNSGGPTATNDVIFHFFTTSSNWASRAYVKFDGSATTFTLGVRASSPANATFAPTSDPAANLATGTTYFVVLGLDFVTGAANNVASIWINPQQGQASPVTAPLVTSVETGTEFIPTAIAIRQGGTVADIDIDDIRVGTWADVTPANAAVNDWALY